MLAGTSFTKTWRLRNIGACTWNSNYALIFVDGERMTTFNAIALPEVVRPNDTIDLSVGMFAPSHSGHYRSYWMLRNPAGQAFGIGAHANKPFWVDIEVVSDQAGYAYDFALSMCAADWSSSASHSLPCPGDENSPSGSVVLLNAPVLETGKHENEPTLWTRPEATHDGWIKGVYPSYRVRTGDRFMADIGCLEDSIGCDVTFYLDYQVSGGPVHNLGSWHEVYDGNINSLVIDLSFLAGQPVQFILRVVNHGRPSHANAFWLAPSIRGSSSNVES